MDHRQLAVQVFQGPHDLNRGGGGRTAVIPGNTNDNKAANLSPSEHTLALSPSSCPCPRCAHHPGCPRTDLTASCLSSHSTNPKQCCPRAITKTYQAPQVSIIPLGESYLQGLGKRGAGGMGWFKRFQVQTGLKGILDSTPCSAGATHKPELLPSSRNSRLRKHTFPYHSPDLWELPWGVLV